MQIHFCDLCNESVPESDLERGRAFLRKGRVVCASCDAAMTGGTLPVRGGASVVSESGAGTATSAAPPVHVVHAPYGAPPSAPASPQTHALPHVVHTTTNSGAGIAVAIVAVVLVFVLGFWVGDQLQRFEGRVGTTETSLVRLEADAARARDRLTRAADELGTELDSRGAALRAQFEQNAAAQSASIAASAEATRKELAALTAKLAELERAFGQVGRHDQELAALAKRADALAEVISSEAAKQAAFEAEARELFAGRNAVGESAPAPAQPAWQPLVAQLSSKRATERWTAMTALVETRDPAVVPHLLPLLDDEDLFNRMATARMLGDLGSVEAVPALIETLRDENASVRDAAYLALKAITKRDLPFDAHDADEAERMKRVRAWEDWWKKSGAG